LNIVPVYIAAIFHINYKHTDNKADIPYCVQASQSRGGAIMIGFGCKTS